MQVAHSPKSFWTIADLMRSGDGWSPAAAIYARRDDVVFEGQTWARLYDITCLSEPDEAQLESSVTLWPAEHSGGRRLSAVLKKRLLGDVETFGYTVDADNLKTQGFLRATRVFSDAAQAIEEARRLGGARGEEKHSGVASSRSRARAWGARGGDAAVGFWTIADALRGASYGFEPMQASYAQSVAAKLAGYKWKLDLCFDVQLQADRTTFAPPFTSRVWLRPSSVVAAEAAARLRSAGIYRGLLFALARQGFHGRWSSQPGVNSLSGEFEKFSWKLRGAQEDVKRLNSLSVTLLRALRDVSRRRSLS